jgi:type V secretory pathway adhesin AidA
MPSLASDRTHHGINIGDVHQQYHARRVLLVNERSDVGDSERAEQFLALR